MIGQLKVPGWPKNSENLTHYTDNYDIRAYAQQNHKTDESFDDIQFDPFVSPLYKKRFPGRAQWLTPVVPALWEAEAGGS